MDTISPGLRFSPLPEPKSRWGSFGLSFLVQLALVTILVNITFTVAPELNPLKHYDKIELVPATPAEVKPVTRPMVRMKPLSPPAELTRRLLPTPEIEAPKINVELPKQPLPKIEVAKALSAAPLPKFDSPRTDLPAGPKVAKTVATTNFGGSSAIPTLNRSARQVQTGGFGDPNGVPVNNNSTGKGPMIAKLGSFDLPPGGGYGNGTGGTHGARGVVASAGFGNGMAIQGGGGRGGNVGQGRIQTTNFASVPAPAPTPAGHQQVAQVTPKTTPVSLLSKPTPVYTDEARKRKIEGDVQLEVLFTASGQVRVLRVLQGLGYGLDEAAVRAAEQIRFSPAQRDGQPVDSDVKLRIVFQIS